MFLLKTKFPQYYRYHGRKITKKISQNKLNLLNTLYDKYSIDQEIISIHETKNLKKKFKIPKNKFTKTNVEIGFGDGEFLIQNAIKNPNELFIGIEVYINGIARVLSYISKLSIKNIKLSNLNSLYFLEVASPSSLDKIYIINPDPWSKKRHNKRRFITSKNIKLIVNLIKKRNSIYITTDSEEYFQYIEKLIIDQKEFFGEVKLEILNENDKLFNISRYQRKATKNGEKIYLITI